MADAGRDLGSITRFKGSNFHLWKFQMRAILLGKELMDIVAGTLPKPAATELLLSSLSGSSGIVRRSVFSVRPWMSRYSSMSCLVPPLRKFGIS